MYLCSYAPPNNTNRASDGHRLCDYGDEREAIRFSPHPTGGEEAVYFTFNEAGAVLLEQWLDTAVGSSSLLAGIIADWLQDHRDLLLSGAVGPNPAERLEQVIDWFRQHFERGGYAQAE